MNIEKMREKSQRGHQLIVTPFTWYREGPKNPSNPDARCHFLSANVPLYGIPLFMFLIDAGKVTKEILSKS